jgi:diguanylate cyclase (GGDEF)-like protein
MITHFGHKTGLPSGTVRAFARDGAGFVWIGTEGGLGRWDGYAVRVFLHDEADPHSLPGNVVSRLLVDRAGGLWVETATGSVARYDEASEAFRTFPIEGRPLGDPIGFATDATGRIWVDGLDGLASLDPATGKWTRQEGTGRVDPSNQGLLAARDGSLWVAREASIGHLHDGRFDRISLPRRDGDDPVAGNVTALFEDDAGIIWYGTRGGWFGRFDPKSGKSSLESALETPGHVVTRIASVEPGILAVATDGAGLSIYTVATRHVKRVTRDSSITFGLEDDSVYALLVDPGGLVFLGTDRGVDIYTAARLPVTTIMQAAAGPGGLSNNDALSVLPRDDGKVWIGLREQGLDLFDPTAGRVASIRPAKSSKEPGITPGNTMLALTADGPTGLIAGATHGMYQIDETTNTARAIGGALKSVDTFLPTSRGLWFGTEGDGLAFRDPQTGKVRSFVHDPANPDSLASSQIYSLLPAAGDQIWVGTSQGLDLFDPDTGRAKHFVHDESDPTSLPANIIWALHRDKRGRLWVGTEGNGLGILDADPPAAEVKFHHIGRAEGLPHTNIDTLLEDDDGRMWVSTDEGLAVVDPDSLKVIRSLKAADGMVIDNYWANSGARMPDGTLLFGGQGGLSVVHPDRLAAWTYQAPVRVSDVRIDGRHRPAGAPIILGPDDRSLQIEFSALDFSAPAQNRYAYRLVGFDPDWIAVDSSHRIAAYSNLPPGDYRLLLRGSNRDGVWTDPPTIVPIMALPAWYQTLWFRSAEIGGLIVVVYLIVRLRTAALTRRRAQLVREITARTQELVDANAALAHSAETLRTLGEIGQKITASLDPEAVLETLYKYIGTLIQVDRISVLRLDPEEHQLIRIFGLAAGETLPPLIIPLDSPDSQAALAVRERREVLVERNGTATDPGADRGTGAFLTTVFTPLVVDDRVLGVMSVHAEQPKAYGERERLILRTLSGYVAVALDHAEAYGRLDAANAELERLAGHDPLTGLCNRRRFFSAATEEISRARRYGRPCSILMVDLDHFKRINDTYGHGGGDQTLRAAAECLTESLRATDLAARYGGEELVALLPETDIEGAVQVAERFRCLLEAAEIPHDRAVVKVTASIGVSNWVAQESSIEPALERADAALYRVKRATRNGVAAEPAPFLERQPVPPG